MTAPFLSGERFGTPVHGPIGIVPGKEKLEKPTQIMMDHFVIKIASGNDHLVYVLPVTAQYTRTLGAGEQVSWEEWAG